MLCSSWGQKWKIPLWRKVKSDDMVELYSAKGWLKIGCKFHTSNPRQGFLSRRDIKRLSVHLASFYRSYETEVSCFGRQHRHIMNQLNWDEEKTGQRKKLEKNYQHRGDSSRQTHIIPNCCWQLLAHFVSISWSPGCFFNRCCFYPLSIVSLCPNEIVQKVGQLQQWRDHEFFDGKHEKAIKAAFYR